MNSLKAAAILFLITYETQPGSHWA